MLSQRFEQLMRRGWAGVFAQDRTLERAIAHAMAMLCTMGRRTISRMICALGLQRLDWSAQYKMYSRSEWDARRLFDPVVEDYLERFPGAPIVAVVDDTKTPKTGRKIPGASWQRDPMSPPFHTNLVYAIRFLQASLLFPLWRQGDFSTRAIPIRFQEAPVLKKPGKRASEEQRAAWREARQTDNLMVRCVAMARELRADLDAKGAAGRNLLVVGDGAFCNRTTLRAQLDRTDLLARCRKDAKLCRPAAPGGRRRYDANTFTPEQVRLDETIPWISARVHYGGQWRVARCKQLQGVLWRRGAATRPLRLLVLAPIPYKNSPNARTFYSAPAYYLTTDPDSEMIFLVQAALDRWQIEVNHREEKDNLGVGQAQVRSPLSVRRQPVFAVAAYSLVHLAALQEFGPGRTHDYIALPKWRRNAKRPSFLDLAALIRKEHQEMNAQRRPKTGISTENTVQYAYT